VPDGNLAGITIKQESSLGSEQIDIRKNGIDGAAGHILHHTEAIRVKRNVAAAFVDDLPHVAHKAADMLRFEALQLTARGLLERMAKALQEQFAAMLAAASRRGEDRAVQKNSADIQLERLPDMAEEFLPPRGIDAGERVGSISGRRLSVRADLSPVRVSVQSFRRHHVRVFIQDDPDSPVGGIRNVLPQHLAVAGLVIKPEPLRRNRVQKLLHVEAALL